MIRTAAPADIPRIQSLMQSEAGFWKQISRSNVLEMELMSAKDLAIVWEEDGNILGYACAHDLGFRAYLSQLIVDKAVRGRGIGRRLVVHLEEKLHTRGCPMLIADVWKDSAPFYRSMGWSAPDVLLLRKEIVSEHS